MIVLAVVLAPATALVGCKSDGDGGGTGHVDLATPVAIGDGAYGSSDALPSAGTHLIKSQEAWEAGGFAEACPAPMDFEANDVVVIALGQRPSAGYWVSIDAIQQVGDELLVQCTMNKPGDDDVVAAVLTYPYHAVMVPKTGADLAVPDPTYVEGQDAPE